MTGLFDEAPAIRPAYAFLFHIPPIASAIQLNLSSFPELVIWLVRAQTFQLRVKLTYGFTIELTFMSFVSKIKSVPTLTPKCSHISRVAFLLIVSPITSNVKPQASWRQSDSSTDGTSVVLHRSSEVHSCRIYLFQNSERWAMEL